MAMLAGIGFEFASDEDFISVAISEYAGGLGFFPQQGKAVGEN